MPDQQSKWEHEDDQLFRQRLRQLQQNLSTASAVEREARSSYAFAVRARKEAQLKLAAFLEEDLKPLPLFDARPNHDPEFSPEEIVPKKQKRSGRKPEPATAQEGKL